MDEAGQASTDYTVPLPSDALQESIMSKLNFAVYPAITVLALAAAFSAHAQSANDLNDRLAYGATPLTEAGAAANVAAKPALKPVGKGMRAAFVANRTGNDFDPVDRAAYGATAVDTLSIRTRSEVRAEALAARDSGWEASLREGGDPQYVVVTRPRTQDTTDKLAKSPAKAPQ
jgi:hypothetical protein